jgi:hypothetical protein
MCQDKFERRQIKMGSGVPTIPVSTDHRNGDWIATDIYDGELYMDTDTGLTYTRNGSVIQMSDGRKAQLVWEALVTQTGTGAPALTVIENSLGITASPTYGSVGVYSISGFASNLTGNIKIEALSTNGQILVSIATSSVLGISSKDSAGVPTDGLMLSGSYIRITKY